MTRRWMSCAKDTDWHTSRHRHLVTTSTHRFDRGWADTLCGATGTPGTFRVNRTKPPCPACCDAAGIAVPNSGQAPTERGSSMTTTGTKRTRTKHDTPPKAKDPLTAEQVKEKARAYADRRMKTPGTTDSWTTLYIKAWKRMTGMANTPPGPVA